MGGMGTIRNEGPWLDIAIHGRFNLLDTWAAWRCLFVVHVCTLMRYIVGKEAH